MKYPILTNAFRANFHQDWDLCSINWHIAIDKICKSGTNGELTEMVIELHQILVEFSDEELDEGMYPIFRLNYDPSDDGLSNREWFQLVLRRVETYLKVNRDLESDG